MMEPSKLHEICIECGGYCCSFGGTVATREEVDEILKAGHKNHFVGISNDCYNTIWGDYGVCPYLENATCTIYELRPKVCRKFPILSFSGKKHYLVHCPLTEHLSKEDIDECISIAKSCPAELIQGASIYLEPHGKILDDRINEFEMEEIELG